MSHEQGDKGDLLLGRDVGGKYVVTRLIGRGGMGAVYEAEHGAVGKKVAIKFIDQEWAKDEIVASRFAREARAANAIESEHVVNVFDAGTHAGRPYLVMELLRGEDLGARLRRERTVKLEDALHVVAQVLRGLARAHAAGIVHRDLKPDNVFLIDRGEDGLFVKIVDFGISKIERPKSGTAPLALTRKGIVLGTPFYMPPEQAQAMRDVDARADLYAVGAILFECLTGRPPHTGETYEQVIVSICMRDAPDVRAIVPTVPEAVARFVSRALARDRAHRFQSAAEMLAALRALAPSDPMTRPVSAAIAPAPVAPPSPGPATDVSWTASDHSEGARASIPEPVLRAHRTRSRFLLGATAIGATVAGLAATLGIVAVARSDRTAPAPAAITAPSSTSSSTTTTTTTTTTTPTPTSTPTPTPTSTPAPTSTPLADDDTPAPPPKPTATTTARPTPPARATATATQQPAAPKPLDIQRELP